MNQGSRTLGPMSSSHLMAAIHTFVYKINDEGEIFSYVFLSIQFWLEYLF